MKLDEAKQILKNRGFLVEFRDSSQEKDRENGYLLKESDEVPTNKVYIVVMDGGETDDDYAVFTSMLEAHKWGDNNCKYDYTVKTSKMF